jgi:ectoine hydroxylase-related dioxygenase (phytanoyl-CoA dioxygenase family)
MFHRDWPGATTCSFTALCSAVSSSIRVLADRVGDLIGTNVQLIHHTKMFIKPPERAGPHASGLLLFSHERDTMIASTIHFDDCADRKRGVRVVPGSHKRAVYGARDGGRHLPVEQYPVSEGTPCPAAAGVVLYFSYLTTPMDRASIPATSRAPRCGADCATPTIVRSAWICTGSS